MRIIYLGDGIDYSQLLVSDPPPLTIGKEYEISHESDGEFWIQKADDGTNGWRILDGEFRKVRNFSNLFGLLNR